MFNKDSTILFQGDSITDGGRSRDHDINHFMGHGYAYIVAARVGAEMPERALRFINRGCSGNRLVDLVVRWQADTLGHSPDVVSILVGVNDTAAAVADGIDVSGEEYVSLYDRILRETSAVLPKTRFVLCDPFVLPVGEVKTRWGEWRTACDRRCAMVKRLAREHKAIHVRSQHVFDQACTRARPEYWLWDGVHPTPSGHELLAKAWIEAVGIA